ncbi:hypothetical protein ACFLTJ_00455 [Chloroflexota bacterium]
MGNASDNGNSAKLLDWDIQRVKKGLDEDVVGKIITELVKERDALVQRTEHMSSLTRLAEETVSNADDLAKKIQDEATERANNEAKTVIAKAEEEAKKLRIENQKLRHELRESSDILCQKLISEPEDFVQRIKTLWAETDTRMNNLLENTEPTTAEEDETKIDNPDGESENQPSNNVTAVSTEPTTAEEDETKIDNPDGESENQPSNNVAAVSTEHENIPPLWRDKGWH